MLSPGMSPDLGELHSSPSLSHLAAELTGITDDPDAAQWIVRVVLSLAYWPIASSRVERKVLQRFLAPAFSYTTQSTTTASALLIVVTSLDAFTTHEAAGQPAPAVRLATERRESGGPFARR